MGCLDNLLTNPHVWVGLGATLLGAVYNTILFYSMCEQMGMVGAGYGKKHYLGALMAATGFVVPGLLPITVLSQNPGLFSAYIWGALLGVPGGLAISHRFGDVKPLMRRTLEDFWSAAESKT